MSKNESFTDITEEFLKEIVKEVRSDHDVDIKTKVEVLKEMTRWVQVKNKVAPEGAEGSKIDEYRAALAGGSDDKPRSRNSGRVGRRGAANAKAEIARLEAEESSKVPEGKGHRAIAASASDAGRLQNDEPYIINPPRTVPISVGSDPTGVVVSPVSGFKSSGGFGGI